MKCFKMIDRVEMNCNLIYKNRESQTHKKIITKDKLQRDKLQENKRIIGCSFVPSFLRLIASKKIKKSNTDYIKMCNSL